MERFILLQVFVFAMAFSACMCVDAAMKNACTGKPDFMEPCPPTWTPASGLCIPMDKSSQGNNVQYGHYKCVENCNTTYNTGPGVSRTELHPHLNLAWVTVPISGMVLEVFCQSGYVSKLTGASSFNVSCNGRGEWEDCGDACVRACTTPTTVGDIPNAFVPPTGQALYQTGGIVTLNCNPGFVLSGTLTATCGANGWAKTPSVNGECIKVCTNPPPSSRPSNPTITMKYAPAGPYYDEDYVKYECPAGSYVTGDLGLTCNATGNTWVVVDSTATCTAGCPAPTAADLSLITNAKLPDTLDPSITSYRPYQNIQVTCEDGYQAVGAGVLTCVFGGWQQSSELTSTYCRKVCGIPDANLWGPNAVLVARPLGKRFPGAIAAYTCMPGYSAPRGLCLLAKCKNNGKWKRENEPMSGNPCQKDCAAPSSGQVTALYPHGVRASNTPAVIRHDDVVAVKCPPGYQQTKNMLLICVDGTLTRHPDADDADACALTCNGQPSFTGFTLATPSTSSPPYALGATVPLECPGNSEYSGGCLYATCEEDGNGGTHWVLSDTSATCSPTCVTPDGPFFSTHFPNGVAAIDLVPGNPSTDNIPVRCGPGYTLQGGSAFFVCDSDTGDYMLSPDSTGRCRRVCGPPDDCHSANSNLTSDPFATYTQGSVVFYKCAPGFYSKCPLLGYCGANGWTFPGNARCERVCDPPTILNGRCEAVENPTPGRQVICECDHPAHNEGPGASIHRIGRCIEDEHGNSVWRIVGTCPSGPGGPGGPETVTVCEHGTLLLNCPPGFVIAIQSASYGRSEGTSCPYWRDHNNDTNCHAAGSLDVVRNSCNGLDSCSVDAENHVFGDPCVGTYKYLLVDYECGPGGPGGPETVTECEGGTMPLNCPSGYVIAIISASYGRSNDETCNPSGNAPIQTTNCRALSSLEKVENRCNGLDSCSVPVANSLFGDPCPRTSKYLVVDYECVPAT